MNNSLENKPKPKLDLKMLPALAAKEHNYLWLVVLAFFLILYGYLFWEINGFSQAQPTQIQISNDLKTTALPAINQSVVTQLEQLKNNSVSVQALFNQARSNPFQ